MSDTHCWAQSGPWKAIIIGWLVKFDNGLQELIGSHWRPTRRGAERFAARRIRSLERPARTAYEFRP